MNRNLRYLLRGGVFWSIFDTLTVGFIIAFALVLGADDVMIGVIAALPYIAVLLTQVPAVYAMNRFGRKQVIVGGKVLARLTWLVIVGLAVFMKNEFLIAFVVLLSIFWLFNGLIIPSWISVMGAIVPRKIRGTYFGKKNAWQTGVALVAALVAGFFLDIFPRESMTGFLIMFAVAAVLGLVGTQYLSRLRVKNLKHAHWRLKDWLNLSKQFKRFMLFHFFFNFAFMLASPFIVVYMLKDLNLSYSLFVVFITLEMIAIILGQVHWGKLTDRFGDKRVAVLTCIGTSSAPFLFLFINESTIAWIGPVLFLSGLMWAGFNLSMMNLLLDLTSPRKRAIETAIIRETSAVPLIVAPIVGGLIAQNVVWVLSGIPLLFLLSGVLRVGSALFLLPLREPRVKTEEPVRHFLRDAVMFHPFRSLQAGMHTVHTRLDHYHSYNRKRKG